ncbi:MAG: hypothetical protein AB1465_02305 [Patescibacteria group bacterium]
MFKEISAKTEEKYANQHELQTKAKSLISDTQTGKRIILMRYSKPVAVLLSMDEYCKLSGKDCNVCIERIRKILKK